MKSNSKSIRKKPNDPRVNWPTDRSGNRPAKEIQTALNEKVFRFTHNKKNTAITTLR